MSERTLGDISINRIHQMFGVLQLDGFSADLFHRLRLDEEFRKTLIEHAKALDKDIIGKMWIVEYDPDFHHPATIIRALGERSPYSGRHSYLLKDEILCALCEADAAIKSPLQFPMHLYALPLYKRMTRDEVDTELLRRELISAGALEALCLATWLAIGRDDEGILVLGAEYHNVDSVSNGHFLCLSRNGERNPMLCLSEANVFNQGTRLLVKRKPV